MKPEKERAARRNRDSDEPPGRGAAQPRNPAMGATSAAVPLVKAALPLPMDATDVRGVSQLVVAAVTGVTDLVEEMHRNIAGFAPVLGRVEPGTVGGISGQVYAGVRGITRLVGRGVDAGLTRLAAFTPEAPNSPVREATRAALNGVLGDHLAASGNPLAVPMSIRLDGRALPLDRASLTEAWPSAGSRLLLLVHGLCMNDLQWQRDGHEHGRALADRLGLTPIHLHYNSGLHISSNGRELSALIEQLVAEWPLPVQSIDILGHSMGGLLARSASHQAVEMQHNWTNLLRRMVFLGSPHHGAALERAGNRVDLLLGASPYAAPFARLGKLRSAGVRDLRHGNLLDADWQGREEDLRHDTRTPVPLPAGVRCHAIAGSRGGSPDGRRHRPGDGLVSIDSALGRHPEPQLDLQFAEAHTRVFERHNHFDLLGSPAVFEQLHDWLQ